MKTNTKLIAVLLATLSPISFVEHSFAIGNAKSNGACPSFTIAGCASSPSNGDVAIAGTSNSYSASTCGQQPGTDDQGLASMVNCGNIWTVGAEATE